MVCSDVCNGGNPYEDWYVDPQVIKESVYSPFVCNYAEAREIFV